MMNTTILTGRLVKNPEIIEEKGAKKSIITLGVSRSFKNSDGVYETDFIPCTLFNFVADSTAEYCKKGDVIGVKGRLQSTENGIEIIAEKITFLSSKKEE